MPNMYSVYDDKAKSYGVPYCCPNNSVAERVFSDACCDRSTLLSQHPEDFHLYLIGSFNDDSGLVVPQSPPTWIANAVFFGSTHDNSIPVSDLELGE